jgi:hypothetical protein
MRIILCSLRRSASGKRAIWRARPEWFKKASSPKSLCQDPETPCREVATRLEAMPGQVANAANANKRCGEMVQTNAPKSGARTPTALVKNVLTLPAFPRSFSANRSIKYADAPGPTKYKGRT